MKIRFLGSSDMGGIPTHNCYCSICNEYREAGRVNTATCAYIEHQGEIILLDTGYETLSTHFDTQTICAVLLTHFHADHAVGLLRLRYSNDIIVCHHPEDELGFGDLFKYPKAIEYVMNTPYESFIIGGLTITPVPLYHSKRSHGYIIDDGSYKIGYLTDCSGINPRSMKFLRQANLDECYIDACFAPNYTNGNHLNYEEATLLLDQIGAKNSWCMHGSHFTRAYIKDHNITLKYPYIEPWDTAD